MTIAATGTMRFPSVPGGNGFSVSKGGSLSSSFSSVAVMTQFWVVLGTSTSAPTTFAGFTNHITEQAVLANSMASTFNAVASSYQGSFVLNIPAGLPSWTSGQHLWAGLFSTSATPSGSDVPDVVLDLGTVTT